MADDLASLTAEDFRPHRGTRFTIRDRSLACELIEVSDSAAPRANGLRAPFSLVFRGPPEPILPQGIQRIEHDELGQLAVFLVPIGPDEAGMRYEAVFG